MSGDRLEARVDSPTEVPNPRTRDIDKLSTEQALRLINAEDASVPPAVERVLPELAAVVDEAVSRVRAGGRVHYFGAGTSGRLAVLDAAEVAPTFGLDGVVVAHMAGGSRAFTYPVEGAEDRHAVGAAEARGSVSDGDLVLGLTASGRTPYVGGALSAAADVGAFTVLVTCNPVAPLASSADVVIAVDTGPEVITGSTRLKAGTAEKLILNAFSTILMVRLGRTYGNMMVDLRPTNAKLRGRALSLLMQATGAQEDVCHRALEAAGDVKTALVAILGGCVDATGDMDRRGLERCRSALEESGGVASAALDLLRGEAGDRDQ